MFTSASLVLPTIVLCAASLASHAQSVRFAVIGDYGVNNSNQANVAARVLASNPDLITTVGDNTYFTGNNAAADFANWDRTQGKYYAPYIRLPSNSAYAAQGSATNRFFPTMGNHDWDEGVTSYTNYFSLPGNERYYTFSQGPVQFFMLSSDPREPDGNSVGSTQYNWFVNQIAQSTARWQVVMFHHPFQTSTGSHAPANWMNWGFQNFGVDAVFSGHNHFMERLDFGGIPWFVTGSSGNSLYNFNAVSPNSRFRNNTDFGFMMVNADNNIMNFQFINTAGTVLHSYSIPAPSAAALLTLTGIFAARRRRQP